jgi:hypothetical protein
MNEQQVLTNLKRYFHQHKVVSNIYYFEWESDLLVFTGSEFTWEVEVKLNRSDFLADFHKQARCKEIHKRNGYKIRRGKIIHTGEQKEVSVYKGRRKKHEIILNPTMQGNRTPNRFYFCVPEHTVEMNEIPSQYGLIEFTNYGAIEVKKQAKAIHDNKVMNYQRLWEKMYYKTRNLEIKMARKNRKF